MDHHLTCLITQDQIAAIVDHLAQELDRDYANRSPLLIGVLKGSFVFLADLMRAMQIPLSGIEFIKLSSYGSGTVSSGNVALQLGLSAEQIRQHHVILVEDIVDTGNTTTKALQYLQQFEPKSLALCALLDKPERRQTAVLIDYLGLTIPNHFIVGYGIDFNEQYRQLPAIYTVNSAEQ